MSKSSVPTYPTGRPLLMEHSHDVAGAKAGIVEQVYGDRHAHRLGWDKWLVAEVLSDDHTHEVQ